MGPFNMWAAGALTVAAAMGRDEDLEENGGVFHARSIVRVSEVPSPRL